MKRNLLMTLGLVFLSALCITSCNAGSINEDLSKPEIIQDKYRNMYQIFPYSYADSNKDGVGDLKGITDKLDYISDLNYTGIWLTPIHKSSSYHKYDVDDYKTIDPKFGTIEDFDKLMEEVHKKKMTLIIDLVLNHTSDEHFWFQKCLAAHRRNMVNDRYYNYYNFKTLANNENPPQGYTRINGTNLAYESQFYSGMPDLNLNEVLIHPNGGLANDIKSILKFWLVDHHVDGFRLDAVTSYFTGDVNRNKDFLTWLNKEVKALKKDAYIVGEGSWGNKNENETYYKSGVDGFFMFEDAEIGGYIAQSVIQNSPSYIYKGIRSNLITAGNGIPVPFVANHDIGRLCGSVLGKGNPGNVKLAHGLLNMMTGTTFSYYGDEIGMSVYTKSNNERVRDEEKRQPMLWGDEYTCKPVIGSAKCDEKERYPFKDVKTQLEDPNSIVNYVKKANLLRLQIPEIARGSVSLSQESIDGAMVSIKKTYKQKSVWVVINAHRSQEREYDFTSIGGEKVIGQLVTQGKITQENKDVKKIKIPAQGIAIIR